MEWGLAIGRKEEVLLPPSATRVKPPPGPGCGSSSWPWVEVDRGEAFGPGGGGRTSSCFRAALAVWTDVHRRWVGDRRRREAVDEEGGVGAQARRRRSPRPGARRRAGGLFKNRLRGHVGSSWNGVWLPVAKKRYFRPLRLLDEATAGARWRVVELALGLRLGVARRSAPAAADRRARASAPRKRSRRTLVQRGPGEIEGGPAGTRTAERGWSLGWASVSSKRSRQAAPPSSRPPSGTRSALRVFVFGQAPLT